MLSAGAQQVRVGFSWLFGQGAVLTRLIESAPDCVYDADSAERNTFEMHGDDDDVTDTFGAYVSSPHASRCLV